MKEQIVEIPDFFQDEDNGYLGYARYSVENRALPSIIDGQKPGARKLLHSALKTLKGEQKYLKLVGATYEHSLYHHGDKALIDTITTLSQHYSDNLAPFKIIGAEPELRSHGTASPRYLGIKLSKYAELYKQDSNILEYKVEDGQKIEPKYYLPLIPIALTKRTSGMGLGYKYESSISYCPLSIIDACISHLKGTKKIKQLLPYIKGYTGDYKFAGDGRVWASAKYVHKGSKITVTELVPSVTFEKYEELLDKAKTNGHILDWENNSKDDNIEYVIKGNTSTFDKLFKSGRIYTHLKLGEYFKRPTLTMLDEFGKVIEFDTVEQILRYFTDFRLRMYDKTKESKISALENEIKHTNYIIKFIELYLSGKIKLDKNTPIEKTISVLDKHELPHFVLDIKIRKLTKEEYNKLKGEVSELEKQLKRVKTTPTLTMYLEDLQNLKKDLKNDFPKINNYDHE